MAKNDLGFEQEEFQSMSDNPFERADQDAQEPGAELGALEVSPSNTPRSFRNSRALQRIQYKADVQSPEPDANEQAILYEQAQNQEAEILEEQILVEQALREAEEITEIQRQQSADQIRAQNTQKIFLWGTITILLFPPLGIMLLKYPILVEKMENGSLTLPVAAAQRLLGKYAPYPIGKKFMAEFMIWFVPSVWSVLVIGLLIVLAVYVSIMSMCSYDSAAAQATLGSACEYYFGISSSPLQ